MNWKKPKKKKKDMSIMNIGGVVGYMNGGTITDSSFSGKIIIEGSYDDYVAGLLENLNVGGIAGSARNAALNNVRSDGKIYIRDSRKFESLEKTLESVLDDVQLIQLAKLELEGIKSNIGKPGMYERIQRFLNLVKGVKDVVEPFVPYLMSLV
jgi:hypothetical protein